MNNTISIRIVLTSAICLLLPILGEQPPAKAEQALRYKGKIWQEIGSESMLNWRDANNYCNELLLSGYSGWRLPTRQELTELVVCTPPTSRPKPQKPEEIIIGEKPQECQEDAEQGRRGRIHPAFSLQISGTGLSRIPMAAAGASRMPTADTSNKSRYWTSTAGYCNKSIRDKSDKPDGFHIVSFLYDFLPLKFALSPDEHHFVRCVHSPLAP